MNLKSVSVLLTDSNIKHVFVDAGLSLGSELDAGIHFKSSAERAKDRKENKKYRMTHKSQLKKAHERYERRMKTHKPNPKRSAMMKKIAQHYGW